MTTAIKTKTTVCTSVSYFGEKCSLLKPHTKRHTWDSDAYRRRRLEDIKAKGLDPKNPANAAPAKKRIDKASKIVDTPKLKTVTSEVIDVMISFDTTGSMAPCLGQGCAAAGSRPGAAVWN